jgi:hypothetical protein
MKQNATKRSAAPDHASVRLTPAEVARFGAIRDAMAPGVEPRFQLSNGQIVRMALEAGLEIVERKIAKRGVAAPPKPPKPKRVKRPVADPPIAPEIRAAEIGAMMDATDIRMHGRVIDVPPPPPTAGETWAAECEAAVSSSEPSDCDPPLTDPPSDVSGEQPFGVTL